MIDIVVELLVGLVVGTVAGMEVDIVAAEVDCSKLELALEEEHTVAAVEQMYFVVADMVVGTVVDMLVALLG